LSLHMHLYTAIESEQKALAQIHQRIEAGEFWSYQEVLSSLVREEYKLWYIHANDANDTVKNVESDWYGFVMVQMLGSEAEIMYIFVDPSRRGLKLGSQLLSGCVTELKKQGVSCLRLEVKEKNIAAQSLYLNHDFVVTGRRKHYYRDGSTAIMMERKRL